MEHAMVLHQHEQMHQAVLHQNLAVLQHVFATLHRQHYIPLSLKNTLLQQVAKLGKADMAAFLIQEGADIHANNQHALIQAVKYHNLPVVTLLLQHGADVHVTQERLIKESVLKGNKDLMLLLIEHDANFRVDDDRCLRTAAMNGHLPIVKKLIELGANIHSQNDAAIRWAALESQTPTVEFLALTGANVRIGIRAAQEIGNHTLTDTLKQLPKITTLKQKRLQQLS